MMKTRVAILFAILLVPALCRAEVVLYLQPRAVAGKEPLTLGDIARIEGDRAEAERLARLTVDPALYADGIVDRAEVKALVRPMAAGTSVIYGGGVRVEIAAEAAERESADRGPLVVKGRPVRFAVTRGGVRAEVAGTALQDGAEGEIVSVKVHRSKIARGRVTGEGMVEMEF